MNKTRLHYNNLLSFVNFQVGKYNNSRNVTIRRTIRTNNNSRKLSDTIFKKSNKISAMTDENSLGQVELFSITSPQTKKTAKNLNAHNPTDSYDRLKIHHKIEKLPIEKFTVYKYAKPDYDKENFTRIIMISDTHNKHRGINPNQLPPADILLHSGDITKAGDPRELEDFMEWLKSLTHIEKKVIIAGNHDLTLHENWYLEDENYKRWHRAGPLDQKRAVECVKNKKKENQEKYGIHYLEDNSITIHGLKIFGSPWSAFFHNWAFNIDRGTPSQNLYSKIPDDIDILLTHGPPCGAGDLVNNFRAKNVRVGCVNLMKEVVERIQPKIHQFGHIHEDYGVFFDGVTHFVNASTCTLRYSPDNGTVIFDLPKEK